MKQWKEMVREFLADRFELTLHHDTRQLSAYVLTIANGAGKLGRSQGYANDFPGLLFPQPGVLSVRNGSIEDFCQIMQSVVLDRPVVDQTGLDGRWDFTLKWTPDEAQFRTMGVAIPPPSGLSDAPPALFTAIQEQIGLKFTLRKTTVPVLMIDRVVKPSAN